MSYNWSNFDGRQFQKLCNALLLFEVSKFAHVFSAEGKDGGIDQYYIGNYEEKNGKWRFQDKFHNSGNNANDIAALKRDIIKDIELNSTNENFIVLISNLNLNKKKFDELEKAGQDALIAKGIKNCEFNLWHHAKLETFLTLYPIVYHWFWERETVLLQPYEEYFKKQLNISAHDLRYQLSNTFYGREKQIVQLADFVNDASKSTIAVIANGGYGKTRLVVEFLKNEIAKNDDWLPLVISHAGFNPNQFAHLLKSKKKLLLFIDNAHEVVEIISEAKRLIENTQGKHKLILTTRPTLYSDILQRIPTHSRNVEKLNLLNLPYEETKKMFHLELPRLKNNQIIYLAQISKGVPNVILELVRLIRLGKQPQQISAEEVFSQSVQEIFQEAVDDVKSKTGISEEITMEFIRLISLISPVSNNEINMNFIAELLFLRKDKVELLINELLGLGLLESMPNISIKPDPYSDTILTETIKKNKEFIEHVRNKNGAENYLENILKNLSEAEIANNEKQQFIDDLLSGYVHLLEDGLTDVKKIKNIFEFVEKIVVYKPWAGLFTIRQFLRIKQDITHPVHSVGVGWSAQSFIKQIEELTVKIFYGLCSYTLFAKNNIADIHSLVEEFVEATENLNILNTCYMYHEWDFQNFGHYPRQCCEKQYFLKSVISEYLQNGTDLKKVNIALHSAKFLLELEFQLEQYYEAATMAFHYGHAGVPYCKHIKEIRTDIIRALIAYYEVSSNTDIKDKILPLLQQYFFYCSINSVKRHSQDLSEEIDTVLNFFKALVENNPNTHVKNMILSSIRRFEISGFKSELKERIEVLKTKAGLSQTLYEELELNLLNDNYFDVRKNFETCLQKLIRQYASFDDFQEDLLKIRLKNNTLPQFREALTIIGKSYPKEAKDLFQNIRKHHQELISEGVFLIRDFYREEDYFYSILEWLWENKETHLQSFFWLLSYGRNRDKNFYKISDLIYYDFIISNNKAELYTYISYMLPDYAYLDKGQTFNLLNRYMKSADANHIEYLMFTLFDEKEGFIKDFGEDIKKLFDDNIGKIEIADGRSNPLLKFIDDQLGFDELFNFINKKIEVDLQGDDYKYYNLDRNFYRNANLSQAETYKRYIKVLGWYITNRELNPEKNDCVIEIFRPNSELNQEIKELLLPVIQFNSTDKSKLILVANSLKPFQNSDEWINIMSIIAEYCSQLDHNFNLTEIYGSSFYHNTGGKSRVGKNVPYKEDLAKKILLENIINQNQYSSKIITYLKSCLKRVKDDIGELLEQDNEESKW